MGLNLTIPGLIFYYMFLDRNNMKTSGETYPTDSGT